MNPDDFRKIEKLVRAILAEGVHPGWQVYMLVLGVAAIGAYVGTYFKKERRVSSYERKYSQDY